MKKSAIISDCQKYRYLLIRRWGKRNCEMATFIGLNPSTADAKLDDPTIRRCVNYSKDWGYGGLYMVNLFAFRSTDPKKLKEAKDPIGPLNDLYLEKIINSSDLVVAAWGTHGRLQCRDLNVRQKYLDDLFCLGVTKDFDPRHPLYMKKDLQPINLVSAIEQQRATKT